MSVGKKVNPKMTERKRKTQDAKYMQLDIPRDDSLRPTILADLFLGGQPPASRKPRKAKPGGSRTQDIASKSIYHGAKPALWHVLSLGRIGLMLQGLPPHLVVLLSWVIALSRIRCRIRDGCKACERAQATGPFPDFGLFAGTGQC